MRAPDWQVRLIEWAERRRGAAFSWGDTDCMMLAFEAADAMTGGDLAERYRMRWYSSRSAREYVRDTGETVYGVVTRECETMPVAGLAHAQAGDLLLVRRWWRVGSAYDAAHVLVDGRHVQSSHPRHGVRRTPVAAYAGVPGLIVLRIV